MPAPKRQQGQSISKHDEAIDDYIASLEASLDSTRLEVDELRAALRPFADAHHKWDRGEVLGGDMGIVGLEHFARAALELERK